MTDPCVVILGTLDTKGPETAFLNECIRSLGWETRIIDTGLLGPPAFTPDVTREEVAAREGKTIEGLLSGGKDKVAAINTMAEGVLSILKEWLKEGEIRGVIALGGGVGTWLATAVMRSLPLGFPKVMVSTLPFQDIRPILGTKDIVIFPSVADILGLNPLLRMILRHAAACLTGMTSLSPSSITEGEKKVIGATGLGITTPALMSSKRILETQGLEMTCYHATGSGGRAFEEGIGAGMFSAVLDLTTHEITNQLFKGIALAGPDRLETAGRTGIPQVVAPGAVDVISRGPIDTLRAAERKRPHYRHSPFFTHVRVSRKGMGQIGEVMADKLNLGRGPAAVAIPLRGFSQRNRYGDVLYDPEGDGAFITTLKKRLNPRIRVVEVDAHINDEKFAFTACGILTEMMAGP